MINSFELLELFLKNYFRNSNKKVNLTDYNENKNSVILYYTYSYNDSNENVRHNSEFEVTYLELLTFVYNENRT